MAGIHDQPEDLDHLGHDKGGPMGGDCPFFGDEFLHSLARHLRCGCPDAPDASDGTGEIASGGGHRGD